MRIYEQTLLTEDQCVTAIDEWKEVLCLNEWTSFLVYIDCSKEGNKEATEHYTTRGMGFIDFYNKCITIHSFYPSEEMREESSQPWDMEKTLVHELLHIHFAHAAAKFGGPEEYTKTELVLQEQSIEAMAHALVSLKRNKHETQI